MAGAPASGGKHWSARIQRKIRALNYSRLFLRIRSIPAALRSNAAMLRKPCSTYSRWVRRFSSSPSLVAGSPSLFSSLFSSALKYRVTLAVSAASETKLNFSLSLSKLSFMSELKT